MTNKYFSFGSETLEYKHRNTSKDFSIFSTSTNKHRKAQTSIKSIKGTQVEAQNCEWYRDACKRISNFVSTEMFFMGILEVFSLCVVFLDVFDLRKDFKRTYISETVICFK